MSKESTNLESLTDETPAQIPQETKLVSRSQAITTIWKRGLSMFVSYSHCYGLLWFQVLAKYLPGKTADNMAATALSLTAYDFCVMLAASTSFALSPMLTPLRSQIEKPTHPNDSKQITIHKNNMSRSIKNGVVIAAPFILLSTGVLVFSEDILINWFNQDETVSGLAAEFLVPIGATMALYSLRGLIEQVTNVHGQELTVAGISLASLVVFTIVGSSVLGIYLGMGLKGLVWAAIAENIATLISCGINLRRSETFKDFHFAKSFFSFNAEDRIQLKQLLPTAMFFFLTFSFEWFMTFLINSFAGRIGKDELGALNLVSPVTLTGTMMSMAFGMATLFEVGGAGNHQQNAIRSARYGMVASTVAVATLTIFIIFPSALTPFANDITDETLALTTQILPWTVGATLIYNLALNMLMSLRAKNRMLPNLLYLGGLGSGALISWALGLKAKRGLQGIVEGAFAGPALAAAAVAGPFLWEFRSKPPATAGYISLTERTSHDDDSGLSINRSGFALMLDAPEPPARVSSSRYGCFGRVLRRLGLVKPEPVRRSNFDF